MAATATADYLRDPDGITQRSFAIIRQETDIAGLPADLVDVAYRMVHASGMTDLVADLAFSADVAEAARGALAAGAPILADCQMVASGISRGRLAAGNEVICTLAAPGLAERAESARTTRSAAAVDLWRPQLAGALCVIGNAPTALFRLLELLAAGAPRPAAIDRDAARLRRCERVQGGARERQPRRALPHPAGPAGRQRGRRGGGKRARGTARRRGHTVSGWLTVIGLGEEGPDALAPAARALIAQAEVLVGGERHLAMISDGTAQRLTWRRPLTDTVDDIRAVQGRRVVVLATGDPFCFGIGTTLRRAFPDEEIVTIPAPSAFSLARARLGWSADETVGVTLHGRPLETVRAYLAPGQRLLALSHDGATPAQVAAQLTAVGYGASTLTVFAHMGGADEACTSARADRWGETQVPDLNTVAIECRAEGRVKRFRGAPGLPDRAFENDGQLTKREVRVQTVSALDPRPGALLWDVGAGSGSVAIEWLLSERTANAVAVERDADRCARIARNAAALGVPRLKVQEGAAPEALEPLPAPDAVFIGGGLTVGGLIETCWARLAPGGTLVANAVTVAGEAVFADWCARHEGFMTRLAVSRARPVGRHLAWRPLMPVTQLTLVKPR